MHFEWDQQWNFKGKLSGKGPLLELKWSVDVHKHWWHLQSQRIPGQESLAKGLQYETTPGTAWFNLAREPRWGISPLMYGWPDVHPGMSQGCRDFGFRNVKLRKYNRCFVAKQSLNFVIVSFGERAKRINPNWYTNMMHEKEASRNCAAKVDLHEFINHFQTTKYRVLVMWIFHDLPPKTWIHTWQGHDSCCGPTELTFAMRLVKWWI